MKKNAFSFMLIAAVLLIFGCRKEIHSSGDYIANFERQGNIEAPLFLSDSIPGLAYDDSLKRAAAPAFRDMSDIALDSPFTPEVPASDAGNPSNTERKLVKRADIRIRLETLEEASASVSELMRKYNAYAASTEIEENSHRYSLRVPSSAYDAFLDEMDGMGRVIRRTESTEDVTVRYYDLEGRLATKTELLKTYQSYLGRAKNIEEILSVEARIADLQNEIDRTGTQFRGLANQVDYATISLNLLGPAASTQYKTTTFGERVKVLFGGFGSFLSVVAVIIMGIVVYGIPILLLAALFYWVLLGRIGLMKKLWQTIISKKQG